MKKIISITTAYLLISLNTFAQYSNLEMQYASNYNFVLHEKINSLEKININHTDQVKNATFYSNKSKNLKIAGWCFLGGGTIGLAIGLASFPKGADLLFTSDEDQSKVDLATTITIIGSALMIGSIPFFVISNVNKRKAKLLLKNEKTTLGIPYPKGSAVSGITLNIALGK